MTSNPKPLFLFSLPRSGSTLFQRILASHEKISTVSEPSILLPYLYTLRTTGIYAEYGHKLVVEAIEDFTHQLPNGMGDYLAELGAFALRLYAKAAKKDAVYFLDKTPRYHLVVQDVIRMFPEGKFIFLWRNPLAIAASMTETWGTPDKWKLHTAEVDLFAGLANLVATYEIHASKVCALRYEDLLINPEDQCRRIFAYLDLSFNPELLSRFGNVQLDGRQGDREGMQWYQTLSKEPLNKWKRVFNNPIRKAWCSRYLRWIGRERLKVMGYDLDQLMDDLNRTPSSMRWIALDLVRFPYCALRSWAKSAVLLVSRI
jgi:Sulfotransferase family